MEASPDSTAFALPSTPREARARARSAARWLVFPLVVPGLVALAVMAFHRTDGTSASGSRVVTIISLAGILLVAALERLLPFRRAWNADKGDTRTDLLYTLTGAVVVSAVNGAVVWLLARAAAWTARFTTFHAADLWARAPLVVQILFALAAGDLLTYWLHRRAHEGSSRLWRFHQIHHSAERLYFLNAGRAHPLESAVLVTASILPAMALGAPVETLVATATFLNIHSVLRHSNVDVRLGPLNWVFSMSEGHRWHHSANLDDAKNYGVNLMLWDWIFGTSHLPKGAPARLGLAGDTELPRGWLAQLKVPFRSKPR